jgi:hypothetical protein
MSAASLLTPEQAIRRMQSRARWSTMQGSGQPRPALPCQRRGLQLQSGMRRWRPSAGCVGVNKGAQAGSGGGGRGIGWQQGRLNSYGRAARQLPHLSGGPVGGGVAALGSRCQGSAPGLLSRRIVPHGKRREGG